jgi:hypothetical protein
MITGRDGQVVASAGAHWLMGAVDELGSRGLTHWSRAVINGLCFANTPRSLRDQL